MSDIQNISISSAQTLASVSPQSQQSLQPFANLDLTSTQRSQLRSIFSAAKQNGTSPADVQKQVDAVLTPAQQQTLQSDRSAFKAGGHHHHAETGDATSSQSTDASTDALGIPAASASSSATSVSASASISSSTDATILAIVTNLQNQATAAQSTLNNTLHAKLVAATSPNATASNAANAAQASEETTPGANA